MLEFKEDKVIVLRGLQLVLAHALTKLEWSTRTTPLSDIGLDDVVLQAARNQVVGVQVIAQADEPFTLALDRTNWVVPEGFQPRLRLDISLEGLPAESLEVFAVGYLEDDDRRWRAEYLDHAAHAWVPARRPQAVYVRIHVPGNQAPGAYQGRVAAYAQSGFGDEVKVWERSLTLQVAQVVLPDPKDWSFHLDLWQHATSVALHHHAPLWSDAHFSILERYFASLAALGQKALTVIATDMPWSGQRCFRDEHYPSYIYEHAIVDVRRDAQGKLQCDFAKLERLLQLAADYGMDREIEVFGLLNIWVDTERGFGKVVPDAPDSIRVRCYDESSGAMTLLRTAEELKIFIRALATFFDETGRMERVRITADEPADVELFTERLQFVREAAPAFRYKVAINHYEFMEQAEPEVVDWVPNLNNAFVDPDLTRALTTKLRAQGGKMCWYICCGPPIPNTFLRSPLPEARLLGWLTHYLDLDGFLRWAFCLWPAKPYERISYRAPFWSAGDMHFVLPGPDGMPVETLRYEALRAGIQDYALLQALVPKLGKADAAAVLERAFAKLLRCESVAEFVGADPSQAVALYSLDPGDYDAAMEIVLAALSG